MLSHGGAFFSLLPIALFYAVRYRFSGIVKAFPAAIVSMLLFAPWLFYQHFIDPPGDRLIKMHLAGIDKPDPLISSTKAILTAYRGLTLTTWFDGRIANLKIVFCGTSNFFSDFLQTLLHPATPHPSIIVRSFFETFYSFGWFSPILAFTLWLLLRGWRQRFSEDFIWLACTAIASLFTWALLMFLPGAASIHQGSFFSWIALFICAAMFFWNASRVSFFLALGLNGFLFFYFYVLDYFWKNVNGRGFLYLLFSTVAFFIFVKSCLALQKIFLPSPNTHLNH